METLKKITKRANGSIRVTTDFENVKSMTDQSFEPQSNVNNIMAKYRKTGQISHLSRKQGIYADVSEVPDFMTALTIVNDATQKFMDLPSDIRKRFGNDPANMVDFLADPKNQKEAIELGLMVERKVEPTMADHVKAGLDAHASEMEKKSSKKPE